MLLPKKVKHRKWQTDRTNPRSLSADTRGVSLVFGSFALKSLSSHRIQSNQLESARKAMTRALGKTGKVWTRVFPDRPYTSKPPEVGMGKGKGDPQGYCFQVLPGRIIFEVDGAEPAVAKEALRKAGTKLPVKTRIVGR